MRENTNWHHDEGKPRVDLMPVLSLIEVGKVMSYGATKYGQHNWSKYAGRWAWTQLIASALRHLFAWMMVEDNDKESGLNHLGHVLANIMMLLDLQIMGKGIDDRNPVYVEPQESDAVTFDDPHLDKWHALTITPWQDALSEWLGLDHAMLPVQETDDGLELHDPETWMGGAPTARRFTCSADGVCDARQPNKRESSVTDKS